MEIETIEEQIGARLKKVRKSKKVSRQKLANELNLSANQLRKYEDGINRISAGKLYYISKLLEVPLHVFYEDNLQIEDTNSQSQQNAVTEVNQLSKPLNDKFAIYSSTYHLAKAYKNIDDPKAKEEILEVIASLPDL